MKKSVMQCSSQTSRVLMMMWISTAAYVMAQDAPITPPANGVNPPPANGVKPPLRRPGGPGKAGGPGPGKTGGPGPGKSGEQRFPRPGSSLSPMQSESFERLPEEEKQRMRAAIDKAWTLPALQKAKDRYIRASEDFRATMRQSMIEVDPEVVKILEKLKPAEPRVLPKLPPPTDNAFAKVALERLGMELIAFAQPEHREKIRAIHPKVMQQPEVALAVTKLLEAPPEKRVEELAKLREAYRQAVAKELPNLPRPQQRGTTSADASGKLEAPDTPPEAQKQ